MAGLLGALPLVLGMGEGGELRRPLGLAIMGGLAVSQFITLYTTPVVYLGLERLRARLPGRSGTPSPPLSPAPRPGRAPTGPLSS